MSRPTKLTPELAEAMVGYVAQGLPNVMAARLAGVSETTFYRWKATGAKAKRGKFRELFDKLREADAEFIRVNADVILRAATEQIVTRVELVRELGDGTKVKEIRQEFKPPTWGPAAWLLERRFPELYGRKLEHAGKIDGPPAVVLRDRFEIVIVDAEKDQGAEDAELEQKLLDTGNAGTPEGDDPEVGDPVPGAGPV